MEKRKATQNLWNLASIHWVLIPFLLWLLGVPRPCGLGLGPVYTRQWPL